MEKYIEYVCCNQAPSLSSSSSTKIFCHDEKLCSPCGCYRCCTSAVFNNYTYSILKRICHKIIKNHSRQRCREHYSIFDGGNSLCSRRVFKGQKDGTDIFNNWMQTESAFRKHGCREYEDFRMPCSITNGNGKSYYSWNGNMDKNQNSKTPCVLGERNKNNIWGENKNFRIRAHSNLLENDPKKYNENETKELRKRKEEADYNKDGSKKSTRVKSSGKNNDIDEKFWRDKKHGTTEERDNNTINSKSKQTKTKKNVDQGEINKNEEIYKRNITSKAKQTKNDKNLDKGEMNKNEEEGKDRRYRTSKQTKIEKNFDEGEIKRNDENKGNAKEKRTSKAKQAKIEKNVDQGEINKKEEKDNKYVASKAKQTKNDKNVDKGEMNKNEEEGKDTRYKTSKAKQTKIEKNIDEGEINKNEDNKGNAKEKRTSKAKQAKIEKNVDQGKINKKEEKDNKYVASKAKQTKNDKNVDKGEMNKNEEEGKDTRYRTSKAKQNKIEKNVDQSEINRNKDSSKKTEIGSKEESYKAVPKKKNAKKDRFDDKKTPNVNDKPEKIAIGNKNSAKFKSGSGRSSRLLENESTFLKKTTNKEKSSKMFANRKHHSSKDIIGMHRELQSCRYVRPCDVLRVKLEERDLSRCVACCLPCRPYISCSSYQCGLSCG